MAPRSDEADDALVAALAAGDRAALDALLQRHAPPLFRLAHRLTGNRQDAEDLVQETFARMWEALPRYRPAGRFWPWLRTIAVRLALDRARRRRPTEEAADVPDPAPGPEAAAILTDDARRVREALSRLSPGLRAVVVLLNGEGLSVREVASTLGLSESAVKNRAMRARRMLGAILTENGAMGDEGFGR